MNNPSLYATTVMIWGSTFLAVTYQVADVAPEMSVGYRFLLASLLLLAFCLVRSKRLRFNLRDHGFMAMQGALLFGFNYWLFYEITTVLTSGLVAVLFSTVVFMNIINGRLWLGRAIEPHVVVAALMGLSGIALVFWPELQVSTNGSTVSAVLLGLLGTYCASLGNILSARNQSAGLPVLQTNAYGMLYGAVLVLTVAALSGTPVAFSTSATYLLSLAYLAIFGSIIAFGCYLTLVGRIGAPRAAYASLLFPIVALQLSVWFEGYQWTPAGTMGVSLILLGNLLILTPLARLMQWLGWVRPGSASTLS